MFRSVNTALAQDAPMHNHEDQTPTTPRPSTAPSQAAASLPDRADDAKTPTRATFGALLDQRPLPAPSKEGLTTFEGTKSSVRRGNSQHSSKSHTSEDHDMDDSDDGNEAVEDGSDEESVNADWSSTKKKSQRFYCTDYPPCTLSFTRSEHLARHIRKHTGERPFQCHCSRRFSRLDNLRQHAQTVHVNEEIPPESLAATGTRFQRQVRTDRVRPPGGRARASTAGSQTGPGRGHQRNSLSTSSIGSVSSTFSAAEQPRRRPPQLQMAGTRQSQDMGMGYRPDSPGQNPYRSHSPGGFSTPTSATFSTAQSSPRWTPGVPSPSISHSRTASIYAGHRTPGRRLSVPSSQNPFQSSYGHGPPMMNASNAGLFSPSNSILNSPTVSVSSGWSSRRDSISSVTGEAWRRRTWHPDTYSSGFTSSRLQNVTTNYYATGTPPHVPVLPSNAPPLSNNNSMRLPGIESFDPLPRPLTPVRRQPSPMMIDTPSKVPDQYRENHLDSRQWDSNSNRNVHQLDIRTAPTDTADTWAVETSRAVFSQAEHPRSQPAVHFENPPSMARPAPPNSNVDPHYSAPQPSTTAREAKRHGWYHGPPPSNTTNTASSNIDPRIQRTSPVDSSGSETGIPGTPSSAKNMMREVHPSIMHHNGYVESRNGVFIHNPPVVPSNAPSMYTAYHSSHQTVNGVEPTYAFIPSHQAQRGMHDEQQGGRGHGAPTKGTEQDGMSALDALVAVATSKDKVATAY